MDTLNAVVDVLNYLASPAFGYQMVCVGVMYHSFLDFKPSLERAVKTEHEARGISQSRLGRWTMIAYVLVLSVAMGVMWPVPVSRHIYNNWICKA